MNHPLIPEKRRARRRRLVIGCSLVTLALAAAACGGGNSSSGENKAGGSSSELVNTSPPAAGAIDNLTWDLPTGEPTSLDYAKAADYSPDTVVSNLCDSLLRLNPDFSYSPNLAKSWKYSPDHLTLDLHPPRRRDVLGREADDLRGRRLQPQPDRRPQHVVQRHVLQSRQVDHGRWPHARRGEVQDS